MPSAASVVYYLLHIRELRSIVQWKLWHNPVHERNVGEETESERECFRYLDLTSRSFSAVIKELHPELLMPVCIFYLVLRGLDTVEDDTSIPLATKEPILRNFYQNLDVDGWHFDGNRPEEKDRELLVNFRYVVTEFKKQKEAYRDVIADICDKMGNGMADYCANADFNTNGVDKIADYDLYCHYVAGLVGHGLTRMFVEAKLGNPALLSRPNLAESMGRFLQKTNIIRDIREDFDDKRSFWPREIWSKHVDNFEDLFKPENRQLALNCQSEMVLNALGHAEECLFYLAGLREQSVFNFCAIPQAMAIATLELCFQNYSMFERNIKITKGQACHIMMQSTQNLELVCGVFKHHITAIRKKNRPQDPSYLKISLACAKVEQFIESIFPSPKAQLAASNQQSTASEPEDITDSPAWLYIVSFGTFVVIAILMFGVAWLFGARFDVAYDTLKTDLIDAFHVVFNHTFSPAKTLADAAENLSETLSETLSDAAGTLVQTQKSEL